MHLRTPIALLAIGGTFAVGIVTGTYAAGDSIDVAETLAEPTPAETVTVTETVTVSEAPPACLGAIADARSFAGMMQEFAALAGEYPTMVRKGTEAGLMQYASAISAIADQMNENTAGINELSQRVVSTIESFNEAAADCGE